MKRFILMCALIALAGCKVQTACSLSPVASIQRDTVIQHDSIYVHEFVQGDTVFVTKFQDRWRDRVVNRCDTVYVQPTIPPDKPIPRFYKDCTKGFWILLIVFIGGSALRLTRLIYRHR